MASAREGLKEQKTSSKAMSPPTPQTSPFGLQGSTKHGTLKGGRREKM